MYSVKCNKCGHICDFEWRSQAPVAGWGKIESHDGSIDTGICPVCQYAVNCAAPAEPVYGYGEDARMQELNSRMLATPEQIRYLLFARLEMLVDTVIVGEANRDNDFHLKVGRYDVEYDGKGTYILYLSKNFNILVNEEGWEIHDYRFSTGIRRQVASTDMRKVIRFLEGLEQLFWPNSQWYEAGERLGWDGWPENGSYPVD